MGKDNVIADYIYTVYYAALFSLKKEENPPICNNKGKSGRHYDQ